MGRDKSMVEVGGRPMVEWVALALGRVCDQTVVSGGAPGMGVETLPDSGAGRRGPLAGLVTMLDRFPGETLAVVGVDQPWVRSETIATLASLSDELPVVPVDGGVRQTTCAVYPPVVSAVAAEELDGGGSLQSLLDITSFTPVVDWPSWREDGRSWYSVDTPEALTEGLDRFGIPAP